MSAARGRCAGRVGADSRAAGRCRTRRASPQAMMEGIRETGHRLPALDRRPAALAGSACSFCGRALGEDEWPDVVRRGA
ncbi:MAG: hypothetical protein MZV70_48465 [Desulfobacterales bacterium]|nr:hypothetical protein [Desulfobacterales bacterium]